VRPCSRPPSERPGPRFEPAVTFERRREPILLPVPSFLSPRGFPRSDPDADLLADAGVVALLLLLLLLLPDRGRDEPPRPAEGLSGAGCVLPGLLAPLRPPGRPRLPLLGDEPDLRLDGAAILFRPGGCSSADGGGLLATRRVDRLGRLLNTFGKRKSDPEKSDLSTVERDLLALSEPPLTPRLFACFPLDPPPAPTT
jgi:hypothetical protein